MASFILGAVVGTGSCDRKGPDRKSAGGDVSPEAWRSIEVRSVFFAHQSVGDNVLLGINEIARERGAKPNIFEVTAPGPLTGPGIHQMRIGRNGDPSGKIDRFAKLLDSCGSEDPDIAMLKLCFMDIDSRTDVSTLFEHYHSVLAGLGARHPKTTFVHITVPLQGPPAGLASSLRQLAKGLLRRGSITPTLNAKREEFNAMLRATYAGNEPLFDLARLESTRPDGEIAVQKLQGKPIPCLAGVYTDDGGHLNARGRRMTARELLAFLADLPHH